VRLFFQATHAAGGIRIDSCPAVGAAVGERWWLSSVTLAVQDSPAGRFARALREWALASRGVVGRRPAWRLRGCAEWASGRNSTHPRRRGQPPPQPAALRSLVEAAASAPRERQQQNMQVVAHAGTAQPATTASRSPKRWCAVGAGGRAVDLLDGATGLSSDAMGDGRPHGETQPSTPVVVGERWS
jgi:hypothetical protein